MTALDAIHRGLADPDLDLHTVAQAAASSPRTLQRLFPVFTGGGFRDYLLRVRMEYARGLLEDPELAAAALSVRAVARLAGYNQPANFAKAFRRYAGCAPHEVRPETPPHPSYSEERPGN